jgi:hypothetical protein
MRDKLRAASLPFAGISVNLQRVLALAQSESIRATTIQLQQSLTLLKSTQQLQGLQVQWTAEQVKRQQERLARQQVRLEWIEAMLEQQRNEPER